MNYIEESLLFEMSVLESSNKLITDQMYGELNLLLEYTNDVSVLLEAEGNKQGVIQSIITFIKNLIDRFMDKVRLLTKNNSAFIKRNEALLKGKDVQKLNISVTPYWNQKDPAVVHGDIQKKITSIISKDGDEANTTESLKKAVASQYLDANDNLTQGLKNYYRTGNSKTEERKINVSGGNLSSVLATMTKFTGDYEATLRPKTNEMLRTVNNMKSIIDTEIKSRGNTNDIKDTDNKGSRTSVKVDEKDVKESALAFLGGYQLGNTFNAAYHGDIILTEAEGKSNSSVEVKSFKTENERKLADSTATKNTDSLKRLKNGMSILQNSLAVSLTIYEEQYTTYLNTIKGVVSALKGSGSDVKASKSDSKIDKSI